MGEFIPAVQLLSQGRVLLLKLVGRARQISEQLPGEEELLSIPSVQRCELSIPHQHIQLPGLLHMRLKLSSQQGFSPLTLAELPSQFLHI